MPPLPSLRESLWRELGLARSWNRADEDDEEDDEEFEGENFEDEDEDEDEEMCEDCDQPLIDCECDDDE